MFLELHERFRFTIKVLPVFLKVYEVPSIRIGQRRQFVLPHLVTPVIVLVPNSADVSSLFKFFV